MFQRALFDHHPAQRRDVANVFVDFGNLLADQIGERPRQFREMEKKLQHESYLIGVELGLVAHYSQTRANYTFTKQKVNSKRN